MKTWVFFLLVYVPAKNISAMRWLFVLSLSLLLIHDLSGQDIKSMKESRKEISQKKREARQAELDKEYQLTEKILDSRKFVLEAQHLNNNRGTQITVSSVLNFISIDSLHIVIQIGSVERAGYNGAGGITEEGRVTNWRLAKDVKRKTFNLFMTVQTNHGPYDINMMVGCSGNADASLTGMKAGRLTFTGAVVAREDSFIFKGQSH